MPLTRRRLSADPVITSVISGDDNGELFSRCAIANGTHFPSIIKRTIGIVAGVVSAGEYIGEVFFYGYLILSGCLGEYFYTDGGITSHFA